MEIHGFPQVWIYKTTTPPIPLSTVFEISFNCLYSNVFVFLTAVLLYLSYFPDFVMVFMLLSFLFSFSLNSTLHSIYILRLALIKVLLFI